MNISVMVNGQCKMYKISDADKMATFIAALAANIDTQDFQDIIITAKITKPDGSIADIVLP